MKYIEGYTTCHGMPIAHAWLEFNGKVFDPTLRSLTDFSDKQNLDREYYGLEINKELLPKNQMALELYAPLTEFPSPYVSEVLGIQEQENEKWILMKKN